MNDEHARAIVRHHRRARAQLFGKFRGKVAEVGSGDNLGYIRAYVPAVYGPTAKSPWATPSVPFAGDKHGWLMLPKENDGVWIEFEAGNRDQPIWSGFWWANKDKLPDDAGVESHVLATPKGHQILLDDDNKKIVIKHGSGPSITLEENAIRIQLDEQKKIVIDSSGVKINDTAFKVS
jgi:uncharacterized protein involved in type VI secretion and phage assembly